MKKNNDYLIEYSDIRDITIDKFTEKLKSKMGLPLPDCKISKLESHNDKPILLGNGVYLVKDEENILFVGDCSSRKFAEKIPTHFNKRKGENLNKIDFHYIDSYLDFFTQQPNISLYNYKLILINFNQSNYSKDDISKLKNLLDEIFVKRNDIIVKSKTVAEYIEELK